jgi:hypothetical protein
VPLSVRQIGYALFGLTAATVGLMAYMVLSGGHHHEMDPSHYLMVLIPASVTIAWPFANGWRPWGPKADLSCAQCGTVWLPGEAAGQCPACGDAKAMPGI